MRIPPWCAVRLIDLPYRVGAMIAVDDDGFTNIYINARLALERQKKCLKHELRHMRNDDVFSSRTIRDVEAED